MQKSKVRNQKYNLKLKKGDTVAVTVGKDRGKQGKIERVFPKDGTVLVPGVNEYKKHVKRQGERPGEILTMARPVKAANVALVCPKCKQKTRVGYRMVNNLKNRICRKCQADI